MFNTFAQESTDKTRKAISIQEARKLELTFEDSNEFVVYCDETTELIVPDEVDTWGDAE